MARLVLNRTIWFPTAKDGNPGVQSTGINRLGIMRCKREGIKRAGVAVNSLRINKDLGQQQKLLPISSPNPVESEQRSFPHRDIEEQSADNSLGIWTLPSVLRKTKTVCTIGPSTSTREMIWKLAEEGMNVARLNMSHGDHESHRNVIDLVKEYNAQQENNVVGIMLDTKDL